MPDQIPLNLTPKPDFSFETFEESVCNRAALKAVRAWPNWPSPILALIGPPGSGKTHLGLAWANCVDGRVTRPPLDIRKLKSKHVIFLDNAHEADETELFALLNLALTGAVEGILLAAPLLPKNWSVALPDLKSRLKNIPVAQLEDHDDALLEPIIRKLFEDRGRAVSQDVVLYLLKYHDRSVDAMREIVTELDEAAQSVKKDLTKAFVSRYLASRTK